MTRNNLIYIQLESASPNLVQTNFKGDEFGFSLVGFGSSIELIEYQSKMYTRLTGILNILKFLTTGALSRLG